MDSDKIGTATPEETKEFFERLLAVSVIPFAKEIADVWARGGIAVVGFELSEQGRTWARVMGWDGATFPYRMPEATIRNMVEGCKQTGDAITPRWLNKRGDRVFVMAQDNATFLVNYTDKGWALEPSSTTGVGWMS